MYFAVAKKSLYYLSMKEQSEAGLFAQYVSSEF